MKPSWEDAPTEAVALVQGVDGVWHWGYLEKMNEGKYKDPVVIKEETIELRNDYTFRSQYVLS